LTIKELAPIPNPVRTLASLRPEIENDLNILLDDVVFEDADRKDLAVKPLKLTARALGEE